MSGERLQDHWSSVFFMLSFCKSLKAKCAMKTRVLIRSGPKPNAFLHPNDASDKVWLRSVRWLRRSSCLKVWTDGPKDAGSMGIL